MPLLTASYIGSFTEVYKIDLIDWSMHDHLCSIACSTKYFEDFEFPIHNQYLFN